jgi:hypothetical protein
MEGEVRERNAACGHDRRCVRHARGRSSGRSATGQAGCPSAYELMTVEDVLQIATPGFEDAIRAEDANSDGLLCVHLLPEPIPLFEPTFLYYDNNRHP